MGIYRIEEVNLSMIYYHNNKFECSVTEILVLKIIRWPTSVNFNKDNGLKF